VALHRRLPDAWFVSAHDRAEVARVRERVVAISEASYDVPYDRQVC
jgi:hypothetical protein